jgi:hypothetical protein
MLRLKSARQSNGSHNTRPRNSTMVENGNAIGSDIDAVCELFSCGQDAHAFEYLRQNSESPLQVPFYYLELVRSGKARGGAARPAKLTAEQVELGYRSILQRIPEDNAIVRHHQEMCRDADQFIAAILSSREAILRMPQLHARAFPFTHRLWHVHIPKTAGSSFFSAAADSDWGYLNTNTLSESIGDVPRLATAVHLSPGKSARAIISGHWQLFVQLDSIAPFDRVVVFVRDPLECIVSEFNYAVDVVNGRSNVHLGEPAQFLERGLDPTSFKKSYDCGFFAANLQCSFLAVEGTCESALKNLAACSAELSPPDAVNHAIAKFFPTVSQRWINVSNKHVRSVDISRSLREEIVVKNQHDLFLHQIAKARYQELRQDVADPRHRPALDTTPNVSLKVA